MRAAHTSTSSCTYCETDGSSAEYTFDTTSDDDFVIITSNLCPDHIHENQVGENPNSACVQDDETFYLPKVPVWRDDSGGDNTNNYYALGIMALAISNVALYGPATGPTGGDAGDEEIDTFDYCGAHADPDSVVRCGSFPSFPPPAAAALLPPLFFFGSFPPSSGLFPFFSAARAPPLPPRFCGVAVLLFRLSLPAGWALLLAGRASIERPGASVEPLLVLCCRKKGGGAYFYD